jgi:two-component system chemotaxis response regulator CheB
MQNCPSSSPSGFAAFDAVAIAASLGGPEALSRIVASLPPNFPAALLVVQHRSSPDLWLDRKLAAVSTLPLRVPGNGEPVRPGSVYLAPPDYHMLVQPDRRLILTHDPKVKFCRPSAEPLFTTVGSVYRDRALGVVLTGCNTDGSLGAQSIKWMGGRVLAQDPETCRARGMPQAAINTGAVDFVLPLEKIVAALIALVMVPGCAEYFKVSRSAA